MSIFLVKCIDCDSEKDFQCQSKFDRVDAANFLCSDCKKIKTIESRTRICPKCGEKVISQSPGAKKKAEELGSVCKKCRSNRIPQTLTQEQNEFLTGLMLGDGSLVYGRKSGSLYPRLCMSRQAQDKDYLFWQYDIFKDFYGTEPKYFTSYHNRVNKYYDGYACRTKTGKIFADYYSKWYPNGKKIVPRDLIMTPLTLLIWFLDDGCVVKSSEHSLTIKISTDGFPKEDTMFLAELLGSFIGEKINVYKNGSGWILKASTLAAIKIIKIIDPILPVCMERKRTWKDYNFEYFTKNIDCFGSGTGCSAETRALCSFQRRGDKSDNSKLNWDMVNEIRSLFFNNKYSAKELSIAFSVTVDNIYHIVNNKSWILSDDNKILPINELNELGITKIMEAKSARENLKNIQLSELTELNNICRVQINKLLLNNGFTQRELCRVIGVSKITITKLCRGKNITKETIESMLYNIAQINPNQLGHRTRTRYSTDLSMQLNNKIIEAYLSGKHTQTQLAEMFKISRAKIQRILYKYNETKMDA